MGKRSFYSVTFLALIVSACSAAGAEFRKEQRRTLSQSLFETDFFIVSMSKLPTGHHLVNATLNGTNGDFILDTGASQTVLSERYITRFGVDQSDYLRTEEGAGAGGSIEFDIYNISSLNIGKYSSEVKEVLVSDMGGVLTGLSSVTERDIVGIIGQDLIRGGGAVLDVKGNSLNLRTNQVPQTDCQTIAESCSKDFHNRLLSNGYTALPLRRLSIGHNTIEVSINEHPGVFIIDSGARATFLNHEDRSKFDIHGNDVFRGRGTGQGAGGVVTSRRYKIAQFALAGHGLDRNNIDTIDLSSVEAGIQERSNEDIDGVIGQDILTRYESFIDMASDLLYLKLPEN